MNLRPLTLLFVSISLIVVPQSWSQQSTDSGNPCLLIVVEGLRPEFITRDLMPNLNAFSRKGVTFNNHHSVFPTLTTVNAASIMTGTYPAKHGVLFDITATTDTAGASESPLTAPTLGQTLSATGNHPLLIGNGAWNITPLFDPSPHNEQSTIVKTFTQVVDTYLGHVPAQGKPALTILWLSEPSLTRSETGVPQSIGALGEVDEQIARILQHHKKQRLKVNVFITSDRVRSTHTSSVDLRQQLIDLELKESADSVDVVVGDNAALYVKGHDRTRIRQIVQRLQRLDWVGTIYTQQARLTHPESFVRGALSFQSVYMDHERAPDILVEPAWAEDSDHFAYPGITWGTGLGRGGSSNPFDMKTLFVAAGPDIKRGTKSAVPSAHIDLAPTLIHLLGIEVPSAMDGRVLLEALKGGPKPESVEVLTRRHGSVATWDDHRLKVIMTEFSVEGVDYLDFSRVERK